MITNDNNLPMLFNNREEVDFLLQALRPDQTVLEWGAGGSTIEIARRVKKVYSIEHDTMIWYSRVRDEITLEGLEEKIILVHVPKNKEEPEGHDGAQEHYRDYIAFPRNFNRTFDVVLIDGRARVECAKVAAELLAPDGIIFIHDYKHDTPEYRRPEYEVVETFLEEIGHVFALSKFRKKILNSL